jgi:hypothetical protein
VSIFPRREGHDAPTIEVDRGRGAVFLALVGAERGYIDEVINEEQAHVNLLENSTS